MKMNSANGTAIYDDSKRDQACPISVKLLHKFSVGSSKNYVLKSATASAKHSRFAVASSNNQVKIYDQHGNLLNECEHDSNISHLKLSAADSNILFSSSVDGKIHVWDLRNNLCVQTFYDNSEGLLKPILCFDCNHTEEIICAGTELIREDAFHLFWDRRSSKLLGGYWNSHARDITEIHFHPQHTSYMASSSIDGLINIFDLNETCEDDALMQTINIEAPINTFEWKSENIVSCITSIEEHNLIQIETGQPIVNTSREKLLECGQVRCDYMIDSLPVRSNFLLASGKNSGEVLLWKIPENGMSHKYYHFGNLYHGHTDVVRTISYNDKTDTLLTGGDDGQICLWKLDPNEENMEC